MRSLILVLVVLAFVSATAEAKPQKKTVPPVKQVEKRIEERPRIFVPVPVGPVVPLPWPAIENSVFIGPGGPLPQNTNGGNGGVNGNRNYNINTNLNNNVNSNWGGGGYTNTNQAGMQPQHEEPVLGFNLSAAQTERLEKAFNVLAGHPGLHQVRDWTGKELFIDCFDGDLGRLFVVDWFKGFVGHAGWQVVWFKPDERQMGIRVKNRQIELTPGKAEEYILHIEKTARMGVHPAR